MLVGFQDFTLSLDLQQLANKVIWINSMVDLIREVPQQPQLQAQSISSQLHILNSPQPQMPTQPITQQIPVQPHALQILQQQRLPYQALQQQQTLQQQAQQQQALQQQIMHQQAIQQQQQQQQKMCILNVLMWDECGFGALF